jgi:hypothetical protein
LDVLVSRHSNPGTAIEHFFYCRAAQGRRNQVFASPVAMNGSSPVMARSSPSLFLALAVRNRVLSLDQAFSMGGDHAERAECARYGQNLPIGM